MTTKTLIAAWSAAALVLTSAGALAAAPNEGGWGFSSWFGADGEQEISAAPPNPLAANGAEPSATERAWGALTTNPFTAEKADRAAPGPRKDDVLSLDKPVRPPTPDLYRALAHLAEARGDIGAARAQLTAALKLNPQDAKTLRDIGRLEDRQGRMELAEQAYRRAVQAASNKPGALNDLALCCARQGKLGESVSLLEEAIRAQPTKTLYRNNIAKVLVELGEPDAALAHLAAGHTRGAAHYNLGHLLAARGDSAGAARCFQQALSLEPALTAARHALAEMDRAARIPHVAAVPRAAAGTGRRPSHTGGATPQIGAALPRISPTHPRHLPPVD